jgi:multicomponent Na+:H+ antiporter subunit F
MSVITICYAMLALALALTFVRLAKGPTVADRVVAIISVGMILVYDVDVGLGVFLDAAIVLALVGFAGTVAFAKYFERMRASR